MQEIKNTTGVPKHKKNLLKQFGKLISDTFDLLRETLRFNDAHINHEEVRNNILKESDYMGNSDVNMSDAWKTYRQQMRDITSGLDTVEKVQEKMKFDEETKTHVNFPTKPS